MASIVPCIFAIIGAAALVPVMIRSMVAHQITREREKLEAEKDKTIKATMEANYQSAQTQEQLKELLILEQKIKSQLGDYQTQLGTLHNEIYLAKANLKATTEDFDAEMEDTFEEINNEIYTQNLVLRSLDINGEARKLVFDSLIKDLKSNDLEKQKRAAEILPQFKEEVVAIGSAFIEVLEKEKYSPLGALILNGLGELGRDGDVLTYLLDLTKDTSNPNILAVIGALGSIGEFAAIGTGGVEAVVEQLLSILEGIDDSRLALGVKVTEVKSAIALALSCYGPAASHAIASLIATLTDSEWNVRNASAIALGNMGENASIAIPALEQLKNDKYLEVSSAAAEAINKIQGKT